MFAKCITMTILKFDCILITSNIEENRSRRLGSNGDEKDVEIFSGLKMLLIFLLLCLSYMLISLICCFTRSLCLSRRFSHTSISISHSFAPKFTFHKHSISLTCFTNILSLSLTSKTLYLSHLLHELFLSHLLS